MSATQQLSTHSSRAHLAEDGFVVLPAALSDRCIAELQQAVIGLLAGHAEPGEPWHETLVRLDREQDVVLYRFYLLSQRTMALNRARQELEPLAREMLGDEAGVLVDLDSHILFCLPDDDRMSWTWHQESTYLPEVSRAINFCFPVMEPASEQNGTMTSLKGSHKLGALPFSEYRPVANGARSLVPENIEQHVQAFEEVRFDAELGDVCMFDWNLIHRSNPNRSPHTRVTSVIRFGVLHDVPEALDRLY